MKLLLDDLRLPLAHFELAVTAQIDGSVAGIFGASGAGKTTLLDLVAGVRKPRSGRIMLDDVVFDDATTHLPSRLRRVGYVPQENALFPHMSVEKNIRYGAADTSIEQITKVLEIGHLLNRGTGALSGGEQKRVALARALVASPRLLLLDEPLAGLDRPLAERVFEYLLAVRDEFSIPMLYVTHDPAELARIAEETIVLEAGRVIAKREGCPLPSRSTQRGEGD